MFCIVHNSIQEFTIISIIKSIIFITIMDLYLDYLNYHTALVCAYTHTYVVAVLMLPTYIHVVATYVKACIDNYSLTPLLSKYMANKILLLMVFNAYICRRK